MITKSLNEGLITDIDAKNRIVKGYFSVFGNEDADGDVILQGSYAKTIKENSRIKHLYQHNASIPLSSVRSGRLKLAEDSKGLSFESTVSDTTWGRDVIKLYEDGVIDEHSVMIQVMKHRKVGNVREISELKMWEGSTVTWGSNEEALLTGIKSAKILKALRNGNYENEEVFDLLEIYLAQQEPLDKSTPMPSETDTWADAMKQFTNSLNIK